MSEKKLWEIAEAASSRPAEPQKPCRWCGSTTHAPDWCAASIIHNEKTDHAERAILEKILAIEFDAMRAGKKLADYPQAKILAAAIGRKL